MAHRAAHVSRTALLSASGPAVALALLLGSASSQAASPDRCQSDRACQGQTELAAQLASQTRYEEALVLYQSAYDRFQEPRLLVNIGRCHYRLGRARKALDLYEAFRKAEPDPEPELASRVTQFIADAKRAISTDDSSAKPASPETPPPAATPEQKPAEQTPEPAPAPLDTRAEKQSGMLLGRPTWRVGLGLGALGAGAILIGIGAAAVAANGRCVTPSETSPELCAGQLRTDGQRSTFVLDGITPGVPMLVVGGLLAVGGVVLVALPWRRAKTARLYFGSGSAFAY